MTLNDLVNLTNIDNNIPNSIPNSIQTKTIYNLTQADLDIISPNEWIVVFKNS
jgi:hypothetical protein